MLAALEPQLAVLDQGAAGHLDASAGQLEHDAAVRSAPPKLKPSERLSRRIALDALHLLEPLHARLSLARLRRLVPEALDEALHARDLRLLLLDLLAELDVARGLLRRQACQRPGKKRARPASSSSTEVPTASRNQRSCATRIDRGVEAGQVVLEPLERGDVEVVRGLVEQEQVGVARERACERGARELAAREGGEPAVELVVGEARGRAAGRAPGCASPSRPRARAAPGRASSGRAARRRRAARPSRPRAGARSSSSATRCAARQHVVAQRELALAGRALVVKRDARALLEGQLAAVDARLARDHPQQGRLARAVAARERHAVAALELERDTAEQRRARHVLVESACDHHGHVRVKAKGRPQSSGG